MRRNRVIVALGLLLASVIVQPAIASDQPPCPNDGYIPYQMVPNKQVAEAIYRAVGEAMFPGLFKKYPIVIVEDRGHHWYVSQADDRPPPEPSPGTVIVSAGGGQLYMEIDKCTAAISDAALNK